MRIKLNNLTSQIVIAMFLGLIVGLIIKSLLLSPSLAEIVVDDVLKLGGTLFINILKMLVIPVVFISLVYGASSIDIKKIGRVGGKTFLLYIATTILAITIALVLAELFRIGESTQLTLPTAFNAQNMPSVKDLILSIIPSNPFKAFVDGNMLQIIIFSLLFGIALTAAGKAGEQVISIFESLNHVVIKLVVLAMKIAPYGVFCLIAALFAEMGFGLILQLASYFFVVLLALAVQLFISYPLLLRLLAKLNPLLFFRKMYQAMLFAFTTSSSNASMPVVLETVEHKLGVKNAIASFVIPLGATINMDGTAIMQGVATVFIAHIYHIDIGLMGYLTVIAMATLASIGTAGIPSVGLITLTMVLKQVGLPIEGIALIIGVDRLLDMSRTVVNVSGDAIVACIVGKSEKGMDIKRYNDPYAKLDNGNSSVS